ncbi:hypothetical protein R3P38DRAFT_2518783, partial [Favolaschia claudopus]
RLTYRSKRRAKLVAAGSAPVETVNLVNELQNIGSHHLPSLLPIFFSLLDPSQIFEILAQLDTADPSTAYSVLAPLISQVLACLRGIEVLGVKQAIVKPALPPLWARTLPWIQFFDEYYEHLLDLGIEFEKLTLGVLYGLLTSLLRIFRDNEKLDQVIDASLNLLVLVGKGWRYLLEDVEDSEEGLSNVSHFFACWFLRRKKWSTREFDNLIHGAGGTRMAVASLVLQHFNHLLSPPKPQKPNDMVVPV